MKVFHCNHCQSLVFFESTRCLKCGHTLAFLPDLQIMGSLDPAEGDLWTATVSGNPHRYRLCENYVFQNVCNWGIPESEPHTLCESCQLTRTVPDLSRPGFKEAWYKLEVAKRRLVYTLLKLGCFSRRAENPNGTEEKSRNFACDFLSDPEVPSADNVPVLSGHANGIITINVAEADDAERERRRLQLHEPYRTLLGHFRHESGHYYWDILTKTAGSIDAFREIFGDERLDYGKALQDYYKQGAPADWQQRFVTSYAGAHPWEDWAETWAHYLHMVDTLETAVACGLTLCPPRPDEPALQSSFDPGFDPTAHEVPFQRLINSWFPLTYVLNNLNRGMGLLDGYPFVLASPAIEKLRFVHGIVRQAKLCPIHV